MPASLRGRDAAQTRLREGTGHCAGEMLGYMSCHLKYAALAPDACRQPEVAVFDKASTPEPMIDPVPHASAIDLLQPMCCETIFVEHLLLSLACRVFERTEPHSYPAPVAARKASASCQYRPQDGIILNG